MMIRSCDKGSLGRKTLAHQINLLLSYCAGLLQADFLNYLENYTDSPASIGGQEVESRTRRPFLRRTMMPVVAGAEQDRELAAMHGTRMRNGLECKLMTSTSKVGHCTCLYFTGMQGCP